MISVILTSCKGRIPKSGTKSKSNYTNAAPAAARATHIYDRSVGSDDDDNKVDLNNSSGFSIGSSTRPSQGNYKPSIDLSKIKVEMPVVKVPELKKPNFKLEDYNSKESQERMVKAMMERIDGIITSTNKSLVNMAVVMFMVEAFEFFEDKSTEYIKKMAFDIAIQGAHGYNPSNSNYRINGIDNKLFSGYHILAFYYVSWSLAIPESLAELKLPFDEEYEMAIKCIDQIIEMMYSIF